MFDCVMPTRNARNGLLYTMNGTINIKNKKWANDFSEIDSIKHHMLIENIVILLETPICLKRDVR